ncbi:MAG: DNA cytosine methyltransferase [Bacteroidaceae bacterium]
MDVVSFFAGCGGLDLGFEQAGFHVVWANESEPAVRDTYVRNHPKTRFVLQDIREINPKDIPDCDGFIGGPPCQPWSVAGKRKGLDDQRGQLFLVYIEIIKVKKPKFFLIENVKGLLDKKFQDVFDDFLNRLDSIGYNVQWKLLDAAAYKVPQNRERVFLVGFRKDLDITFKFPAPTCNDPIPLSRAIGDITEPPRCFLTANIKGTNPIRPNHDVYIGPFGSYYNKGNRRRMWERPSFTIHATADHVPLHPSSPKMIYHGHENWSFQSDKIKFYRRLSVRECARIQTFPDKFTFECPDIKALYKMIGNAVPPRLGYVLAKEIMMTLEHGKTRHQTEAVKQPSRTSVLVGYYKDEAHRCLILQNLLYYVRSDGRKGSMSKEDCTLNPHYLLLHHHEKAEIYELYEEEPFMTDASYLKALGFELSGDTYLCFKLKSAKQIDLNNLTRQSDLLNSNKRKYSPYLITLNRTTD